ncbi:MAG TPA: sucrose synthase [Spirochaetota bacterium]|nr:sucrose synthase [Spirochaetota bacterium]HQP47987.1 sucrose synthase [Spirochaetota bacterium]
MNNLISTIISTKEIRDFKEFLTELCAGEQKFLLRNDLLLAFNDYCEIAKKGNTFREKSTVLEFLKKIQELFFRDGYAVIMHRYAIAKYRFYLLRCDGEDMHEIKVGEFLDFKDQHILQGKDDGMHLHIDLMPFYDFSPSIRDTKNIGNGIRFLNRYLCSSIFQHPGDWNQRVFDFLKLHTYKGTQLLVNGDIIEDFQALIRELDLMTEWLRGKPSGTPFPLVKQKMRKSGFEPGWGDTAGRIVETMEILRDLINEPTDTQLEQFITRVPMPLISKIAIISPHGWFGQENVLGKPDTGGQVVYILDQVRALEKYLREEIARAGLDMEPQIIVVTRLIPEAENTSCNVRMERIHQTENACILRIPFRDRNYNIVKNWLPRFQVWPFLEAFAEDTARELISEFQGRPDLVIGNYSDGNLVATLLSDRLDVTQCTIAHALEKTKYLFSDLYWKDMEKDYNFSLQFTADILSMNKSDFIITSTKQEIFGTEYSMGQYESYQFFTMPDLYQVKSGVNLFAPKFNVIPPGVDENMYFPYYEKERRIEHKTRSLTARVFSNNDDDVFGALDDPGKIPVFTMARFDKIKNITGLIEAFGMSAVLKESCNLIFAAGTIRLEESNDAEEQHQIALAYSLISQYRLQGSVRWLPSIGKMDTGEVYRIIAERQGIFVQPALFEAFGLTILESMISGLPTFGPRFGGPVEIIEEGKNGFLLNTSHPELIARGLEAFIEQMKHEPDLWKRISENGIERVRKHFNWHNYSDRLINLAKLYGFWRYSVSGKGKVKMDRYCDFIYHFLFKKRAKYLENNFPGEEVY